MRALAALTIIGGIACSGAGSHSADAGADAGDPAVRDATIDAVSNDGGTTIPSDANASDADDAEPLPVIRALFVGNSYTYTNDLPRVVTELAAASGVHLETEVIAPGGAKLCDHFSSAATLQRVGSGEHDAVVIQGQSVDMFYDGESAYFCGQHIGVQARDAGASIVWFATWARREGDELYSRGRGVTTPEQMTDAVEGFYRNLSRWGPGGHVARVGHGWERGLSASDGVVLHADDGSHPSLTGTFVAACTLAQAILGRTPAIPSPPPFDLDERTARILCDEATREPCFDELQFCGGECLSVVFDPMHCGACDATCATPRECWLSACECGPGFGMPTTFESLTSFDPTCLATAARPARACEVAAHLACADQPCGGSGFGPYTTDGGDLEVMCVPADVVPATYSELSIHHPACNGVSERHGDACRTAAHRTCIARGATAGFGPVGRLAGDDVQIACVSDAEVLFIPDAALDVWGCEGFPDRVWDEACDQAVHRLCTRMGRYGGYGPIEPSSGRTDGVDIVCISR